MLNYLYYFIGWCMWTILCKVGIPLDSWVIASILGVFGIVVFWVAKHFPKLFDLLD